MGVAIPPGKVLESTSMYTLPLQMQIKVNATNDLHMEVARSSLSSSISVISVNITQGEIKALAKIDNVETVPENDASINIDNTQGLVTLQVYLHSSGLLVADNNNSPIEIKDVNLLDAFDANDFKIRIHGSTDSTDSTDNVYILDIKTNQGDLVENPAFKDCNRCAEGFYKDDSMEVCTSLQMCLLVMMWGSCTTTRA